MNSFMYQDHFGLQELPFSLTPDTSYFFSYGHFADALNTLLVALRAGEGFIKVTGEVGTGKTLICRKLLNTLDDVFVSAYIPNPMLTPYGLQAAIAEELGIPITQNFGHHHLQKMIAERIVELNHHGKKVVLCLDEAQALPLETLETLRLLTNLETEKHKLLQVVLFGQPELDTRLNDTRVRQLKQRITFSFNLLPIDHNGVQAYVNHRLVIAGYQGGSLFNRQSLNYLYKSSRGIPRLINILSHKAMMVAYGRGDHGIEKLHVTSAIKDTEDATLHNKKWSLFKWFAAGVTTLITVGAIFWTSNA
jgi:MSHA biogenesis protein MshM